MGTEIATGTTPLIDVFVGDLGIYVVTRDALRLLDRSGNERARVQAPREITSAAFDGAELVAGDRAKLTTFDATLNAIVSADLMESCASSVLVSQHRFICGPSNDWDRVFYTYDTRTGSLLATSKKYTYNGIPMRRVPGTDDFVTVTVDLSPSDFHLYSVATTGEVVFVNESPYHGDFRVTATYAFDGLPPTHLVTDGGLLLSIYGTGCSGDASSFTSACFVKDGVLGTLTGSQVFIAMDSDASGTVYGMVDPSSSYSTYSLCTKGCLLQRINVADRSRVSQTILHASIGAVVAFRNDFASQAVVVGYRNGTSSYYSSSDPYPGYRVELAAY